MCIGASWALSQIRAGSEQRGVQSVRAYEAGVAFRFVSLLVLRGGGEKKSPELSGNRSGQLSQACRVSHVARCVGGAQLCGTCAATVSCR